MQAKKILVADDETHMTYILSFKLRQAGVDVIVAHDGNEALALARTHHPDLIITDYQMPGLSGLDLCIQLRQDPRTSQIPVLMVTGRGHRFDATALQATNVQQLLAKPFSACELMAKVAEIIGPFAGEAPVGACPVTSDSNTP